MKALEEKKAVALKSDSCSNLAQSVMDRDFSFCLKDESFSIVVSAVTEHCIAFKSVFNGHQFFFRPCP